MSTLTENAAEYLALRHSLGFKLGRPGQLVAQFASYCSAAGSELVTTELALAWARLPATRRQLWWSYRLNAVRGFARYLHAVDPRHEIPPPDLLPAGPRRAEPFIYSATEIAKLMSAARAMPHPLMAATYQTYIGLLAAPSLASRGKSCCIQLPLKHCASTTTIVDATYRGPERPLSSSPRLGLGSSTTTLPLSFMN